MMRNLKKIVSAAVAGVMLACSFAVVPKASAAQNYADAELARAVELGFGAYKPDNPAVTYAEFMKMLDKTVELTNNMKSAEWKKSFSEARKSNDIITRGNAVIAVFLAAETLGGDVFARNSFDVGEGAYGDDWVVNSFWGKLDRVPVGFEGMTDDPDNGDFLGWSSHYVTSRSSIISGKPIFEYAQGKKHIHGGDNLKYKEALTAALRLYESSTVITERFPTEEDAKVIAKAEALKKAILGNTTEISVKGMKYYVKNGGKDSNDGKSPETAWATLNKVNEANKNGTLKPGDGVFLNRGDLWRGYIDCAPGVAYSAYGKGEKPKIYGSVESGADSAKWKLWYDKNGVKIWKFYRDITEVGNIVFNDGESYAIRKYAFFNGKKWVMSGSDSRLFDIVRELKEDLTFYSTFDFTKEKYEDYVAKLNADPGTIYDTLGELYLRCDKGNPGVLYKDVEFLTAPDGMDGYVGLVQPHGDNLIDNLSIKYCIVNGISIYMDEMLPSKKEVNKSNGGNTVQNCEIGWCGGTQADLNREDGDVMVCGECVVLKTDNNTFRNNYIYQAACAGIVEELVPSDWIEGAAICENNVFDGNVIERCQDTFWFWDNNPTVADMISFADTKVINNYVMYMGYGWSGDYRFTEQPVNTYHNDGDTWSFAIGGEASRIKNFLVKDNVFYLSNGGWIVQVPDIFGGTCDVTFSGNTYVQNDNRKIFPDNISANSITAGQVKQDIEHYLGDKNAVVFANSVATPDLSEWAKDGVKSAILRGLATAELQKGWQSATTRAEFCRAAVNFLEKFYGKPIADILKERKITPKTFADTQDAAICAAAALGIASATDAAKNTFSPNAALTREMGANMMYGLIKATGAKVDVKDVAWSDAKDISAWAKDGVNAMYAAGIMGSTATGKLTFSPKSAYPHDQCVVNFNKLWDYLKK